MFRFTIRELLLLTLVVGLAVGWWLDWPQLALDLFFTRRDLLWLTVVIAMGVAWWMDRWHQQDHWARQVKNANQQVQRFDCQLRIYQDRDRLMCVYRNLRGQ
jgi:hypothetical protein